MRTKFTFQLDSLESTERLAQVLAQVLRPGDIALLSGDLGAGKTTLVRRIAMALGADPRAISSPTFTVMNEYGSAPGWPIIHMDAYRLEGEDENELLELGWDDSMRAESISFIEWGERIADLIPGDAMHLLLSHEGESARAAAVRIPESWGERPELSAFADLEAELDVDGSASPGFPFATERDQLVDLYHWFGESYRVSRPVEDADLDSE